MVQSKGKVMKGRGTKKEAIQFVREMKAKGIEIVVTGYSTKPGRKRLWKVE